MPSLTITPDDLKKAIRDIPDFPKPGILFRDITPLLQDGALFRAVIDLLAARHTGRRVDAVVGVESRGLIFGAALAYRLGVGLVLVRKAGKLPHKTIQTRYNLEYGEGVLEAHSDSLTAGSHVVLIDDLLATGGTMAAVVRLMEQLRARVVEVEFVVELLPLAGRAKLGDHPVHSLIQYN